MSHELTGPSQTDGSPVLMQVTGSTKPKVNEDEGNIYYVNVIPDDIQAQDLLTARSKDCQIASSFWSAKATEGADAATQKGTLPQATDNASIIKRSNYRIQVFKYAIQHSIWMSQVSTQNASKKFAYNKDHLHPEILKTVLAGLSLPESAHNQFETILKSISDGIAQSTDHKANQSKWVVLTTYRWDVVQKKIFSSMRTIYFSVSQEMIAFNNSKNDKGFNASFDLMYKQDDYAFNESVWDKVKKKLDAYVEDKGVEIDVTNIAVGK